MFLISMYLLKLCNIWRYKSGPEKNCFFLAAKFPMEQSHNLLPLKAPSTHLGLLKGRDPVHEKGTLNLLTEDTVCDYLF